MGGLVKAVTKPVQGLLGGITAHADVVAPDKAPFDITKQAQTAQNQFAPALQAAQANQGAVSPYQQQALTQMGLAATGQGPSLAEAQLRSAQDRGFAQQLAAAQSQRASSPALAQRQLLLNMGNANRDLAQQSAVQRLQERDSFLNQANQQQANLGNAVQQNFGLATAPNQSLQQYELARTGAINQNNQANAQSQNAILGSILSGGGAALGASMGKKAKGGEVTDPQETVVLPDKGFGKIIMIRAEGGPVSDSSMCAPTDKYKSGGDVKGPGTATSDSIATMLSNGEYVVKAQAAQKPGMLELLEKINSGKLNAKEAKKEAATFGHVLAAKKKAD